jgi:hypothetical protein
MDRTLGRGLRLLLMSALTAGALAIVPSGAAAAVCPGGTTMITSKSYTATHLDGTTSTGSTLPATGILPGDTVTVSFTLAPACTKEITFATYRAPSTNGKPFENQVVYDFQTATFTEGFHANALTVKVPGITAADPGDASQCDQVAYPPDGNGANTSGAYDPTCNGSPSLNGKGDGQANGKPCAGCVGNADAKNPPGQQPNGKDPNAGYECDRNQGVGQSNPAHTGCTFFQIDLYTGPVVNDIPANGILFPQQVFDWAFGH